MKWMKSNMVIMTDTENPFLLLLWFNPEASN